MRFGGLTWQGGRLLAVRETHRDCAAAASRHRGGARSTARRRVESRGAILSLTEDSDFLAQPVLSSDGSHLAWIAWDHPNMPWDTTELRVGRLEDGVVAEWADGRRRRRHARPCSRCGPARTTSSTPTTRSGRWNLWRLRLTADLHHGPIAPVDADTGGPLWGLGLRWFAVLDDGRIVAVRTNGDDELVVIGADGERDAARARRHRRTS